MKCVGGFRAKFECGNRMLPAPSRAKSRASVLKNKSLPFLYIIAGRTERIKKAVAITEN